MKEKAPESTSHTRTLQLAADTLGGAPHLAQRLQVELAPLERWIAGTEFPPHDVFLKALDIVAGGTLLTGPQHRAELAQARADRVQAAANRIRESAERLQASAELARAQAALLRKSGKRDAAPPSDEPEKKKTGDA
jgi:hypothetical protein